MYLPKLGCILSCFSLVVHFMVVFNAVYLMDDQLVSVKGEGISSSLFYDGG